MTTYKWQSGDQGWSGVANSFGDTATRSSGSVCATTGYWETVASFEPIFSNRGVVETAIATDSTLSLANGTTITTKFEILNVDYTYGAGTNVLVLRWADVSGGPWTGSSAAHGTVFSFDLETDEIDGCYTHNEVLGSDYTSKYFRFFLQGFGDTLTLPTGKIYEFTVPSFTYTHSPLGIPGSILI